MNDPKIRYTYRPLKGVGFSSSIFFMFICILMVLPIIIFLKGQQVWPFYIFIGFVFTISLVSLILSFKKGLLGYKLTMRDDAVIIKYPTDSEEKTYPWDQIESLLLAPGNAFILRFKDGRDNFVVPPTILSKKEKAFLNEMSILLSSREKKPQQETNEVKEEKTTSYEDSYGFKMVVTFSKTAKILSFLAALLITLGLVADFTLIVLKIAAFNPLGVIGLFFSFVDLAVILLFISSLTSHFEIKNGIVRSKMELRKEKKYNMEDIAFFALSPVQKRGTLGAYHDIQSGMEYDALSFMDKNRKVIDRFGITMVNAKDWMPKLKAKLLAMGAKDLTGTDYLSQLGNNFEDFHDNWN